MQERKTKDVLERARKSKDEDGAEIGCWRVEEHADCLDNTQQLGQNSHDDMGAMAIDGLEEKGLQESEIKGVVERFNGRDLGTEVVFDEAQKRLQVGTSCLLTTSILISPGQSATTS